MDSTVENTENHSDFLTEEPKRTPEPSGDKISENVGEDEPENGDENSTDVGENLDENMSNSDISVNLENEVAEKAEENADKNDVEIVEIEEKLIIETLDEAKDEDGSKESEKNIDVSNEGSENVNPGTSEVNKEATEPADAAKEEDEWIDLLGNELLKKKIIKAGKEDSSRPAAGQEVCIRSEGTLPNGDKVDIKNELTFIVGDGDVITAFDLCVPSMFENEICELATAPRFAYGTLGREDDDEGDVPPDSDITYKLELLSIKPGPNISNLTDEQRIELGDQKRERGNDLFRREEYSLAVHSYSRALKYLGSSTAEAIVELKVKCWNNISASHLKVKEYIAAKKACDSVLEVDPENVKALFRKGKVLHAEGEYEESMEILRKANSLDPENKLIRRELYLVRQKYDENKQKERSMYQRMVGGLSDNTTPKINNTFFTWPVILGITGVALGGVVAALLFSRH